MASNKKPEFDRLRESEIPRRDDHGKQDRGNRTHDERPRTEHPGRKIWDVVDTVEPPNPPKKNNG